jgi:hypothetical protein
MATTICKNLHSPTWKELYHAAISESDLSRLPGRIADAESALVMRVRELFYSSGDKEAEEASLDDAMCILHALRSSLKRRLPAGQESGNFADSRSA